MKTLLIDSNYLCYKAKLTTGFLEFNGMQTGIMFGFFNQLIKAAKKIEPDNVVFFWDSKQNKRKEIYPDYKKRNKDQTEEEKKEWEAAFQQFNQISQSILPQLGLYNNFHQKGYESDDLIAQYTMNKSKKEEIYVATSDDDMLQLLEYCSILNLGKDIIMTKTKFIEEYELHPEQWASVKKIAGCNSDNVPGVSGVGEKTAIKYLKGDLKKTSKIYQRIKESSDLIKFNEQLVVLPFEGTMDVQNQITNNEFSMREFLRFCREYGLFSFRKDEKKDEIRKLFEK